MKSGMKYLFWVCFLLPFINSCHTTKLAEAKSGAALRVITYNIRHGAPIHQANIQLKGIAAAINAQKPDLVALQEVDSMTGRAPVDEAKELGKLTGMNYFFSKTINFQGGEYGDAILSRYPILAVQHDELSMPDPSGEARAVGIITIEPFPGVKINFATTHLDLKKNNRIAEINQLITISKQSAYPLILAGDFNATPGSKEIEMLKKEFTFACDTNCPLTFPSDKPSIAIDYIILNPAASEKFHVKSYTAGQRTLASDHLPLIEYLIKK